MRAIAGIIVVIIAIAFLGLPFIGFMILLGLFMLLVNFATGVNTATSHSPITSVGESSGLRSCFHL